MSNKLLIDLFNGNVSPIDEDVSDNSDHKKYIHKVVELQQELAKVLDPKYHHLINDLSAANDVVGSYEHELEFVKGFSLAIKLIIAGLTT